MPASKGVILSLSAIGFERLGDKDAFAGRIMVGSIRVPVTIEISDWEFIESPVVKVDSEATNLHDMRGHLSDGDVLCYADAATLVLDRYQPARSISTVIELSRSTLAEILHGNTDPAIREELTAYWRGEPYLLIEDARSLETAVVGKVSWDERTMLSVIAASDERLQEWSSRSRASAASLSALHVIQVDGQIPPPPRLKTLEQAANWAASLPGTSSVARDLLTPIGDARPGALLVADNGVIGFQAEPSGMIKQAGKRGFRKEKVKTLWSQKSEEIGITKFRCYLGGHGELVARNLNSNAPLSGKRIALIGCGTIGGFLSRLLVQNGAGDGEALTLIDNDTFLPENIGRHVLGVEYSGLPKSRAMKASLQRDFPESDIEAVIAPAQEVWGQFRRYDLVIDATGDEPFSTALNHFARSLRKQDTYPPVLHAMIFGNGIATQTYLARGEAGDACFKCLKPKYGSDWRFNPVRHEAMVPEVAVRPCSLGSFVPFGVEASVTAATLALRHVLDFFAGKRVANLRTRVIDLEHGVAVPDKTIQPSPNCPECGAEGDRQDL